MREKVRTRQYVMTLHAEEEMSADDPTIFDVERIILSGLVLDRQADLISSDWKYRIKGQTIYGNEAEVVAKLSATDTLVIITVYTL
jgi:hypothetical protein